MCDAMYIFKNKNKWVVSPVTFLGEQNLILRKPLESWKT